VLVAGNGRVTWPVVAETVAATVLYYIRLIQGNLGKVIKSYSTGIGSVRI
jgi:hypothetical protein